MGQDRISGARGKMHRCEMSVYGLVALGVIFAAAVSNAHGAALTVEFTDIEVPSDWSDLHAESINELNEMVGYGVYDHNRVWMWDSAGGFVDMNPSGIHGAGRAVNDAGTITLEGAVPSPWDAWSYVLEPGGDLVRIDELAGYKEMWSRAINNAGEVVGDVSTTSAPERGDRKTCRRSSGTANTGRESLHPNGQVARPETSMTRA